MINDCPSHPHSVDALCALPSDFPDADAQSIVLTGSSDGLVRAVQILPTKLLGVVTDHEEWAIERVSIGGGQGQIMIDQPEVMHGGQNRGKISSSSRSPDDEHSPNLRRRWWVGSAGHDEVLHLTDLEGFFRENVTQEANQMDAFGVMVGDDNDGEDDHHQGDSPQIVLGARPNDMAEQDVQKVEGPESAPAPKKRKRQAEKEVSSPGKSKKGKNNAIVVEGSFFDEL